MITAEQMWAKIRLNSDYRALGSNTAFNYNEQMAKRITANGRIQLMTLLRKLK